jgi:hypothetical protein
MENLLINATDRTPEITFDLSSNVMQVRGVLIPEDTIEFFRPVFFWLNEYAKDPKPTTVVNISLEYFNTSSSKSLLDLFNTFSMIQKTGKSEVTVNWVYEVDDVDMLEVGEDYQRMVELSIHLEPVEKLDIPFKAVN